MKKLLILLALTCHAAEAEIYKSQDENGEWSYSDRPSPSAERMKLPPLSTYTPSAKPVSTGDVEDDGAVSPYKSMVFLEPKNNLTIRDQEGVAKVSVKLDPLLKTQRGHKIQYYLDDAPRGEPVVSSKMTLKNIERGTHVLGASVLDAEGKELFSAATVTFYVRKDSSLNPTNLNNPDNPKSLRNPDNIINNPNNPYHINNNPNAPGPINPNPPKPKAK